MTNLLMPKGVASWLVDNTALTFRQIGYFVGMHHLEIRMIANGEGANVIGVNPIENGFVTKEMIDECVADPSKRLVAVKNEIVDKLQKNNKKSRYTPVSKRSAKPNAIAWLVKTFPNIDDKKIVKIVGTTKNTIDKVKNDPDYYASHVDNPRSPVDLGLCTLSFYDEIMDFNQED